MEIYWIPKSTTAESVAMFLLILLKQGSPQRYIA